MNILIIVAHPKEDSFSFAMANTYKENRESKGDSVEMLDLYRDSHQQAFFMYEDANGLTTTESMKYYQVKITKADEIVFVFPYWWGSFPAILKNFFDWNLSKDFAFKYVDSRPKGLLTDKTVKVFTTTGAPKFIYTITGANRRLKNMMKEQIIQFCGMKLDGFHIFGGVDTSGKNTEKILEEIKAL
jgi:putative NADPH-quinone reductase